MSYTVLLDRYDEMIHKEDWADGRRDDLVKEMDRVWQRMTSSKQKAAVEYATKLYEQRIGNAPPS